MFQNQQKARPANNDRARFLNSCNFYLFLHNRYAIINVEWSALRGTAEKLHSPGETLLTRTLYPSETSKVIEG